MSTFGERQKNHREVDVGAMKWPIEAKSNRREVLTFSVSVVEKSQSAREGSF